MERTRILSRLVGGHCIGVDPYYFIYEAENLGYYSQIISAGRKINDDLGGFIGEAIVKKITMANKVVPKAKVGIFGITFKENAPDTRNSKVTDIIDYLKEYGISPLVIDPVADEDEVRGEYNLELTNIENVKDLDCIVMAVNHKEFEDLNIDCFDRLYGNYESNEKVLIDIKNFFDSEEVDKKGYSYWRL